MSYKRAKSEGKNKNQIDLDVLFKEWYIIKKKKSELEDREDEIKKIVNKILKMEKSNSLESDYYKVTNRTRKVKYVTKNDLPEDIFEKYHKVRSISALYLTKL